MKFDWPDNANCAVVINFEYDAESVEMGEGGVITGGGDYGAYSALYGVPRCLDVLRRYGLKCTFFVSGRDAQRYPDSVKRIADEGHEVAAHGYLHEDFSKLALEEEKEVFEKSHRILTDITGTEPRGFRNGQYNTPVSPNTLTFVRDMGYIYDSSYLDDEVPYQISIDGKPADVIEIPWAWVLYDLTFIAIPLHSFGLGLVLPVRPIDWILDLWKEEFDALYEEVGFFHLIFHPRDIGRGSRLPLLEGIIRHIRGYPDVWFATCSEVAEVCLRQLRHNYVVR